MKKRYFVLSILLLMCALIPLQRAAALSAEIVGDKNKIIYDIDTDDLTFTVRVTSVAGDSGTYNTAIFGEGQDRSYIDPITNLLVHEQTFIGFEPDDFTASPTQLTLNGTGTHDVTFTIPRSKIPDVRDNVVFYFELLDPNVVYDPDDESTWYPFFTTDVIWTLYWRNPGDTVTDLRFSTPQDIQELQEEKIRDITFTLLVENNDTSNPVSVDFSVGAIKGALIDTSAISFSRASVIVAPNSSEEVTVTINGDVFIKTGFSSFTIHATPAGTGSVDRTVTFRVNVLQRVDDLLLDSFGDLTRTSTTSDAEDITWTLRVTNTGSGSDEISFTMSGDIGAARVSPNKVLLFPDSYEDITLTIPRIALSKAGTYNVTVKATSTNDPTVTAAVTTKTIITDGASKQTGDPTTPVVPTPPDRSTHKVIFSEFMFESEGGEDSLPQWIEVYNNSNSAVNLRGWKLQWKQLKPSTMDVTATFQDDFIIPSQQCRVIVSDLGRHSGGGNLSDDSVYLLATLLASLVSEDEEAASEDEESAPAAQAGIQNHSRLIAQGGFSLKLLNVNGVLIDQIGTLNENKQTWQLHDSLIEGVRSSLIRRFDGGVPRSGIARRGWRRAVDAARLTRGIYYGHSTDLGTPGYRRGKPLPVELSHFSAKFVKDDVVINWTTESELNNAGFNIYRSTSPTKNFRPINAKLIQGAGTTGDRNKYQFIDKTAKPNVAYYYRLEDIDLAGTREIIATQQVRGVITPTGKRVTTWGTLKDAR